MAVSKSFSGLDSFLDCERRFYYRKIARLPEPPNMYFAVGNLYHDVIARVLEGEDVSIEEAILEASQKPGWTCPTSPSSLKTELQTNIDRLKDEVFQYIDPLGIECWGRDINKNSQYCAKLDVYSRTTPIVEDGTIVGKEDSPCVLDWKTIFGSRRRSQAEANSSQQLALYCLEANTLAAAFVEVPRYTAVPINTIVVHFTYEELSHWRKWFNVQFEAMMSRGQEERKYRLAVPNNYRCSLKWCPYWQLCPGGAADDPTQPSA